MPIARAIHDYLEDHLDGRLTREGMAAVSAWVEESPANAEALAQWWLLQVQIRDHGRLQDFCDVFAAETPASSFHLSAAEPPRNAPAFDADRPAPAPRRGVWAWATAATIALIATGALLTTGATTGWRLWPSAAPEQPRPEVASKAAGQHRAAGRRTPVAYVGRIKGCQWTDQALLEGRPLAPGAEVALESGNAELIFENGARVLAQGPCRLVIEDATSFALMVGDVSVEASFGFKVTTPSGVVLDLGTAFGVSVDASGGSEVHVFDGEVAFQAVNPKGPTPSKAIVLQKDQACRYAVGGVTLDEFQANESKFSWRHSDLLGALEVPKLNVREGLTLWLAADRFVEVDDQGGVVCWRDLLIAPNTTPEDALQPAAKFRPRLTSDGLNGHPSVRFGGSGAFLLTPPLYTTNDQTAIVVCALNATQPRIQQILNYNGPPQRTVQRVGEQISPGVFQLMARDGDGDGRFGVVGHVFSGHKRGSSEPLVNEAIAVNRLRIGEPLVIALRHSPAQHTLSVYVNGEEQASTTADVVVGGTSRKVFGRHPLLEDDSLIFNGDLGEVLIYNRALPEEEIASVSDYLRDRFEIAP